MKRALALLLTALMLLGLLAACSSEPAATTTPDDTATTEPADEPATEPTDEPADTTDEPADTMDEPADEPSSEITNDQFDADADTELPKGFAEGTIPYPICDPGAITIDIWKAANDYILQDPNGYYVENYAYAKIEEVTGVKVNWNLFSSGNYGTQLSLMFASEDYPDAANVIYQSYAGGWQQAIEDEVIVDLAPMVDEYAPNLMRWVNLTEGNRKNAYTDDGSMPTLPMIYNHAQNAFYGYTIRQDWLEDLGLEMPDTIEEWDAVLHAFKEQKTNGAPPMDLNATGFTPMNFIEGSYNVSTEAQCGLIVQDGKIHSSFRDEGFRDYLELMSGWFAEGMIDPDFTSVPFMWNMDRMPNGESGIVPAMYTQAGDFMAKAGMAPEGTFMALMPYPTVDGYDRKVYHLGEYSSGLAPNSDIIFADSEYVEEVLRWYDYRFSEEGYMLSNYGIEGETFAYDEDGTPRLFDFITNNPDGLAFGDAMDKYLIHNGTVVFLLPREENQVNDEGRKYNEYWAGVGEWNLSGNLTYTIEEAEERGGMVTDITTYINEFVVKVIMGQIELNDSAWAEFQNTLTAYKMDRIEELTQQAYDRYLQR